MKTWKPLTPYQVTRSNTDGCLMVGEMVWFSENGTLNVIDSHGWHGFLTLDELTHDIMDFQAVQDNRYIVIENEKCEMLINREKLLKQVRGRA